METRHSSPIKRYLKYSLLIWVTGFVTLIGSLAVADITLFVKPGKPISDYDERIQSIQEHFKQNPNTPLTLVFSQNLKITALRFLGSGGRNIILDIGNNQVLRLRSKRYRLFSLNALFNPLADKTVLVDSLSDFKQGHEKLKAAGVPIPELIPHPQYENEFLVLEKLNILFDYFDYLGSENATSIAGISREKIDQDFLNFAAQTARLRNIGDFRGDQLVYTQERGWVVMDFSAHTEFALPEADGNIFERDQKDAITNYATMHGAELRPLIYKPGFPKWIAEQARDRIAAARAERQKQSCRQILN